jgi:hypothetical protein
MNLRFFLFGLIAIGVGLLLILSGQPVVAQTDMPTAQPLENASGDAGIQQVLYPDALTSFTVSNPFCYQPDPTVDRCSINVRYIQANDNQSSSPYMTWLAITIQGKKRFSATAFFEGTIYYSYDMAPDGFMVPCGEPNAGGAGTAYGNVYGVTIQPLDSSRNPMSTDIANVTCPAYVP